jgi:hypothetical protein
MGSDTLLPGHPTLAGLFSAEASWTRDALSGRETAPEMGERTGGGRREGGREWGGRWRRRAKEAER